MLVRTESGSEYRVEVRHGHNNGPVLVVQKDGHAPVVAVAVFPDRLPYLEATVTLEREGDRVVGRNAKGVVTIRVKPLEVRRGMVFANRKGFRSTRIMSIED